jgi:hypothetical protein
MRMFVLGGFPHHEYVVKIRQSLHTSNYATEFTHIQICDKIYIHPKLEKPSGRLH